MYAYSFLYFLKPVLTICVLATCVLTICILRIAAIQEQLVYLINLFNYQTV